MDVASRSRSSIELIERGLDLRHAQASLCTRLQFGAPHLRPELASVFRQNAVRDASLRGKIAASLAE